MGIIRECPKKDGQSKYGDTHLPKEDKNNKKKSQGVNYAMCSRNLQNDDWNDRERWRLGCERRHPRM
jgi:hypothetical protein